MEKVAQVSGVDFSIVFEAESIVFGDIVVVSAVSFVGFLQCVAISVVEKSFFSVR